MNSRPKASLGLSSPWAYKQAGRLHDLQGFLARWPRSPTNSESASARRSLLRIHIKPRDWAGQDIVCGPAGHDGRRRRRPELEAFFVYYQWQPLSDCWACSSAFALSHATQWHKMPLRATPSSVFLSSPLRVQEITCP
uniref:C2H2-type domain-containing protein n=1 Tax=Mycena chlorophos TaxID=658473 RepID=A0ABQ0LJZ2_MYCCL|nr:predicted protein [Mycena chlorophos]